ncbi:hypothetical protein XENTR_v10019935 [Xenopus tropicalis]|nr:hypothetical protein XENTR_v10019935 [Xenopus tropicalis]
MGVETVPNTSCGHGFLTQSAGLGCALRNTRDLGFAIFIGRNGGLPTRVKFLPWAQFYRLQQVRWPQRLVGGPGKCDCPGGAGGRYKDTNE